MLPFALLPFYPSFGTNFYFKSYNLKNKCVYKHAQRDTQTYNSIIWVQGLSLALPVEQITQFIREKNTSIHTMVRAQALTPPGVRENSLFLEQERALPHSLYFNLLTFSFKVLQHFLNMICILKQIIFCFIQIDIY